MHACMYVCEWFVRLHLRMNFARLSGQRAIIFLNLRSASIDFLYTAWMNFKPFYSTKNGQLPIYCEETRLHYILM